MSGVRSPFPLRFAGERRPRGLIGAPAGIPMTSADEDGELLDRISDVPDPLLGETLHDTYLLKRLVGEGGMGRVYEAHHTRIEGKRFAVKVLRAELVHSPEVRSRFRREAQAAAAIQHPNVVGVHDFGHTPDGRPYLVAEFLEGIDLRARVERDGPLPAELAVHVARRVCEAVQAAHVHGVIHRDLKPENVTLVGPPDRPVVKVLDFGLSRFMDAPAGTPVTRAGVVMGTPAYMSPEQARGERVDHRADIYGVGVLLYVALTARAPFGEETPQQTLLAVMNSEPPRPREHVPSIPEALEAIVLRAMAREPAGRYPSAADLDDALAPFDDLARPLGAPAAADATAPSLQGDAALVENARRLGSRLWSHRVPTLALLPVIALSALFGAGLHWAGSARRAPAVAPVVGGRPTPGRTRTPWGAPASAEAVAVAPAVGEAAGGEAFERPAGATAVELLAAQRGGVDALEQLAELHPTDPAVLESVAFAEAAELARQVRSVKHYQQLFAVKPSRAAEKEIADVVLRLALGRGAASVPAMDLMARDMGTTGPDLLYELFLAGGDLRDSARERLELPAVRERTTPALAITYALRVTRTCEARLPLLDRAVMEGDERTLAALRGLYARPSRGCGWRKAQPCPAPCPAQAAQFDRAASDLQKRLATSAASAGR
jgi:serine/threonine protein kinase